MSDQRFSEIMDRQTATEREGEAERQACVKRDGKRDAKGFGHKRSVRKRMAQRLAR